MLTRSTPLFLRGDLGCKHVVLFIRPFFSEFSVFSSRNYNFYIVNLVSVLPELDCMTKKFKVENHFVQRKHPKVPT